MILNLIADISMTRLCRKSFFACYGRLLLLVSLMLIGLASCGHKDEPQAIQYGPAPVDIRINIPTSDLNNTEIVDYESRAGGNDMRNIRYIVRAFPVNGSTQSHVSAGQVIVNATHDTPATQCRMILPSGQYKLLAWADYVPQATNSDYYYNTTDFANITYVESRFGTGGDDRNAYTGSAEVDFKVPVGDTTTVINANINLKSVMAKFKYVTTDWHEFADKNEHLRVMVSYSGFLPYNFNMFTNLPFDSQTGKYFITEMTDINIDDNGEATMCFDYVMVNGEEGSVSVQIGLYDDSGKQVGRTVPINVPLRRGGLTVVKGNFLTKTAGAGGIGIDPGFDGDIVIYI